MSADYLWPDEIRDPEVSALVKAVMGRNDFTDHVWESIETRESTSIADEEVEHEQDEEEEEGEEEESVQRENEDRSEGDEDIHNSETRKSNKRRRSMAEQPAERRGTSDEDMKSFIQELFNDSFSVLQQKLEKKIDEGMEKLESEFSKLKESLSKDAATTNPSPSSNKVRRSQDWVRKN